MTNKIRFIHIMKDDDLQSEQLAITDDIEAPAKDFCPPGYRVESDTVHEMDLPSSFPLNNEWIRFG